jgi:hypothetical protein
MLILVFTCVFLFNLFFFLPSQPTSPRTDLPVQPVTLSSAPPLVETPVEASASCAEPEKAVAAVQADSPKKKKKKKNTYASMMADVMAPTLSEQDKQRETEEKLKKCVGGGQFSKLEKI